MNETHGDALPDDEQINAAASAYEGGDDVISHDKHEGFSDGAKWMRERLLMMSRRISNKESTPVLITTEDWSRAMRLALAEELATAYNWSKDKRLIRAACDYDLVQRTCKALLDSVCKHPGQVAIECALDVREECDCRCDNCHYE